MNSELQCLQQYALNQCNQGGSAKSARGGKPPRADFFRGNGLEYTQHQLQNVELKLSTSGQSSIDWPLRTAKSTGIFPCSMTDWLGEFVPTEWSNYMLAVMGLAQNHVFLPLTKRFARLEKILTFFNSEGSGITVPNEKIFDKSILTAISNSQRWTGGKALLPVSNSKYQVLLPWPLPNVLFGVTICNQAEADKALPHLKAIKQMNPSFQLWISYEPALGNIDWVGYENAVDWIVWGGESGPGARRATLDSALLTIKFGEQNKIPVYIKQTGSVLAKELGLKDSKGTDVPAEILVREFPDMKNRLIPRT